MQNNSLEQRLPTGVLGGIARGSPNIDFTIFCSCFTTIGDPSCHFRTGKGAEIFFYQGFVTQRG